MIVETEDGLEPHPESEAIFSPSTHVERSRARSLKRIADALERIADRYDGTASDGSTTA